MTATVTTPTAFPDFAPGDARYLLADVHRWARTNGWRTHRDTGWQNPSRLTQVDWDERGLHIGSRDGVDRIWPNPRHWPAFTVRQAVDMLVALDILPADFNSISRAVRKAFADLDSLHQPRTNSVGHEWCKACGQFWPCASRQAINSVAAEVTR